MYFDRRVHPHLLSALESGGFAYLLTELARSGQYGMDLQLRRNPKQHESWATLYVGTTKILDLRMREKSGKFSLKAHRTWATSSNGWRETWQKGADKESLARSWSGVEKYLELAIPTVGRRFLKEGAIQAGISKFPADDMVVIDRETVVGFTDTKEEVTVRSSFLEPLMGAMGEHSAKWWKPKKPGNECDALAIGQDGTILAIEVKPADVAIAWAPLQARHYADLLQAWAESTDAGTVLMGMYEQREHLGLVVPAFRVRVKRPIRIRPVVAVRCGASATHVSRMLEVTERLRTAGLDSPPMEFREVSLVGRLDPWDINP